jgi:hypothetical protein
MKLSIQIAAIRRKIRRLEEHRPLMMERLQGMSEADREIITRWIDETRVKAEQALESMQRELDSAGGP